MKEFILALFTGLFLIGCGSTTVITNPKYENKDLSAKNIFVMPFSEDIINVLNKDDVADDFENDKREPEVVLRDKMYKSIINNLENYLTGIKLYKRHADTLKYLSQKDSTNYFLLEKRIDKDSLCKCSVPKKEVLVKYDIKPDFVLVLNKISFSRNVERDMTGYSIESLNAIVNFIIYDYGNREILTYGNFNISKYFIYTLTKSTWENVFYNIAKEIFYRKPFKWLFPYQKDFEIL